MGDKILIVGPAKAGKTAIANFLVSVAVCLFLFSRRVL
jgi:DNA helicase TIP49 (TBP-interacting protein)